LLTLPYLASTVGHDNALTSCAPAVGTWYDTAKKRAAPLYSR